MDALELVLHSLAEMSRKELQAVQAATKVPVDTLIKLKYRTTKNPRYDTVRVLAAHFGRRRRKRNGAARAIA